MAKSPINKYRISKGVFVQYVVGIPAYKDGGEAISFTGTNAEANAKCRELDAAAVEPGIKWSILDAVPLTDAELKEMR